LRAADLGHFGWNCRPSGTATSVAHLRSERGRKGKGCHGSADHIGQAMRARVSVSRDARRRDGAMTAAAASVARTAPAPAAALLEVQAITLRFGGIVALDRVSFGVAEGTIAGLIGPNGAGKTSLFNCLSRLYRPQSGDIRFAGRSLLDLPAHGIASLGIGRTFQNLALFGSMSVLKNVEVGAHCQGASGFLADAFRLPATRREELALEARAMEMLALVGLDSIADRPISTLPLGTRKRVELARALAAKPRLLLLDEPASGLNHEELADLGALIRSTRDRLGITVLLVEHHMNFVMGLSDRVVALNFGRVIAHGTPDEVRADPEVGRAYLGPAL
jgi:branched-chain amino acid transport system ATP-binding protein